MIQTNPKDHGPDVINIHDWDGDKINDLVITGGSKGNLANKLIVLLRTNKSGDPTFKEILIDQPCGNFPKDVAVIDLDADQSKMKFWSFQNRETSGSPHIQMNLCWQAVGNPFPSKYSEQKPAGRWITHGSDISTGTPTWMS